MMSAPRGRFKVPRKTYRLTFNGDAYAGMLIRARSVSMKRLLDVVELNASIKADDSNAAAALMELCNTLGKSIIEWNLVNPDDEDGPVMPCTVESLLQLDPDVILDIAQAWMEVMGGGGSPLATPSNSGGDMLTDIPMIPVSTENQLS